MVRSNTDRLPKLQEFNAPMSAGSDSDPGFEVDYNLCFCNLQVHPGHHIEM